MKNLEEFARNFTDKNIDYVQIENKFFLVDYNLKNLKDRIKQEPFSIGLFLGETRRSKFVPSSPLLDILSKLTDKKVFVSKKTAWLFLCGRDIFGSGILRANTKNGLVLVQNERDENLGYGEIVADLNLKNKVVVKNLFDKGDFLRRERK